MVLTPNPLYYLYVEAYNDHHGTKYIYYWNKTSLFLATGWHDSIHIIRQSGTTFTRKGIRAA